MSFVLELGAPRFRLRLVVVVGEGDLVEGLGVSCVALGLGLDSC